MSTAPIWVVDDNAAVAESLTALLAISGLPAIALTSGRLVLEKLNAGEQPSLMVLDLTMPGNGGDGNAVIARIIEHPEWTFPIIVSTGYEDALSDDAACRVAAVLSKTDDPNTMIAHIRGALATQQPTRLPARSDQAGYRRDTWNDES